MRIEVARLEFRILRTKENFEKCGRSARIVVTMGMPAFVYRWVFFVHSPKSLERNILRFAGISPVKVTLHGGWGGMNEKQRAGWLDEMRRLGDVGQ